jgi:hypothetical protein
VKDSARLLILFIEFEKPVDAEEAATEFAKFERRLERPALDVLLGEQILPTCVWEPIATVVFDERLVEVVLMSWPFTVTVTSAHGNISSRNSAGQPPGHRTAHSNSSALPPATSE